MFTVFTPTYNRAAVIGRVYNSLRRQNINDFEWVVVDDGSDDGTEELIRAWQKENNGFSIRYFWQPNQHKKVAFNRGVREARGRWFVPIDSDDELTPDALEQFARMWATIPPEDQHKYCAVVGLCLSSDGKVVGDMFPASPLDADAVALWFDYRVIGEKLGCFKTEALKEFPFPENVQGLVPESVVWFRMAKRYTVRCFNVPVRVYHRDVESLTLPVDPVMARRNRAEGAVLWYSEALDHVDLRRLVRSPLKVFFLATQYNFFSYCLARGKIAPKPQRAVAQWLTLFFRPAGWVLYKLEQVGLADMLRRVLDRVGVRFY